MLCQMNLFLTCAIWHFALAADINTPMILTNADNGRSIVLRKGAPLHIKLSAQLGTGFSWKAPTTTVLKLQSATIAPTVGATPGSAEIQVFEFLAASIGKETIVLPYRQPWQSDVPPVKEFRIEVEVK